MGDMYDTTKDLSFLAVAFAWYNATPFRKFQLKVTSSIVVCVVMMMALNNLVLDYSGITKPDHHMIAFLMIIAFSFFMLTFVMQRYDSLPNVKLEEGIFYHVYGRPRYKLGMIAFYLSLGLFGEHYITNGVYVWKFCNQSGKFERVLFEQNYVHNRKLVLIRGDISDKLNLKLGSDWSFINNCLALVLIALRLKK